MMELQSVVVMTGADSASSGECLVVKEEADIHDEGKDGGRVSWYRGHGAGWGRAMG